MADTDDERQEAKWHLDRDQSQFDQVNSATASAGQGALKALFLMNGGALIAMLTFLSTLITSENDRSLDVLLIAPMLYFSIELAAVAAAYCTTYLSSLSYVRSIGLRRCQWVSPFVSETDASRRWEIAGNIFLVVTIALGLASLTAFVWGFMLVAQAMTAAAT